MAQDIDSKNRVPGAILFLCGQNAIRSPIAEAIAKSVFDDKVYVASAGVRHGERDPFVDIVLDEVGLNLGNRQPQTLEELEDDYFDLIITLAPEAHHRALDMNRANATDVVYWPTPDPTSAIGTRDQILAAYRQVREMLAKKIGKIGN